MSSIKCRVASRLPTAFGIFQVFCYESSTETKEPLAITVGDFQSKSLIEYSMTVHAAEKVALGVSYKPV